MKRAGIFLAVLILTGMSGILRAEPGADLKIDIGVSVPSTDHLDQDVFDLTRYVYIHALLPANERAAYVKKFGGELGFYFRSFVADGRFIQVCQRTSLSLAELLANYGIRTRQWHCNDPNGVGFHQFIEYYDPAKSKWIIFDPYFGLMFRDTAGNFLGVDDVRAAIKRGEFKKDLSVKLNLKLGKKKSSYDWPKVERAYRAKLVPGLTYPRTKLNSLPDFIRQHGLKRQLIVGAAVLLVILIGAGIFSYRLDLAGLIRNNSTSHKN